MRQNLNPALMEIEQPSENKSDDETEQIFRDKPFSQKHKAEILKKEILYPFPYRNRNW
jgi:hypothetical protein